MLPTTSCWFRWSEHRDGSLQEVAQYGMNDQCGLLVNSSRAIIYVDKSENFASFAREAAQAVQREMAGYLHDKGIIPCKA